MLNNKKISLVMPCRNEAKSLSKMYVSMPKFIDEIIVVDNSSTDDTAAVAKAFGAKVIFEKRKDKRGIGYGFAHQKGLKHASGDIIVTMDADATYPLNQIEQAVGYMQKHNFDFVSCNRFPLKNPEAVSKVRQFGVWLLNKEVRFLYGYPVSDILSGMWVVDRKVKTKLKLKEGGWDLSPEIKLEAIRNPKIAFSEYHINHHPRLGESKQKIFKTGWDHFKYILVRRLTKDNPVQDFVNKFSLREKITNFAWR